MRRPTAWIVLLGSAVLEAVWATALGASAGFTQPVPTVVFAVAAIGVWLVRRALGKRFLKRPPRAKD